MRSGLPLYEGDGLIRRGYLPDAAALDKIERDARAMRAHAVRGAFERFASWIEQKVWQARQRDLANALSKATDHADLERRMKALA